MTERFSHTVTLEEVDQVSAQAFHNLLQSVQGALARVTQERNALAAEKTRLEGQVQELRRQNEILCAENQRQLKLLRGRDGHTPENTTEPATHDEPFVLDRKVKLHTAPVHSVTIFPTTHTMVSASWDATVKLYSLTDHEVVRTLGDDRQQLTMGGLYAVAMAKTSDSILGCTSSDHVVYLWNHTDGQLVRDLKGHTGEVNGIDFHTSQQVMATASDDTKVIIWDFQEGIILRQVNQHTEAVYGVTFLGEEHQFLVATCCFDKKIRIFDMRNRSVVNTLTGHTDDVIGIDFSSRKQILASSSDDGHIMLWDFRKSTSLQQIQTRETLHENEVKRVSFTPEGDYLAAACSHGCAVVYDVENNCKLHAMLERHSDCVFDVAWGVVPNSNRKVLVTASHDLTSHIYKEERPGASL